MNIKVLHTNYLAHCKHLGDVLKALHTYYLALCKHLGEVLKALHKYYLAQCKHLGDDVLLVATIVLITPPQQAVFGPQTTDDR